MTTEQEILVLALHGVYRRLNALCAECAEGKPTRKTLMRARAALPPGYSQSFETKPDRSRA